MINHNGTITTLEDVTVNPNNRGFLYGDGVFETLKVVNGKLLFWEDHYFRLMAAMRIMRMEIPMEYTPEYLEEEIKKTITSSDLIDKTCRVRITVYRSGSGTYLPDNRSVGFYAFAKAHPHSFYLLDNEPYEVELYKDHYVNVDLLSTIKTTNKALHVTGSIWAQDNGYDNCLLVNNEKNIVEALQGNLFLVKDNIIKTPPIADGCLRGILRKQLIEIIGLLPEYDLQETSISPFELQKADELFITNTIIGIRPITKYRKKAYISTVASMLLQKLNVKVRLM